VLQPAFSSCLDPLLVPKNQLVLLFCMLEQSCQPLLLALHDLTLLVLAGLPANSAEAIARLKQQLQQETLDGSDSTLPHAGTSWTLMEVSIKMKAPVMSGTSAAVGWSDSLPCNTP